MLLGLSHIELLAVVKTNTAKATTRNNAIKAIVERLDCPKNRYKYNHIVAGNRHSHPEKRSQKDIFWRYCCFSIYLLSPYQIFTDKQINHNYSNVTSNRQFFIIQKFTLFAISSYFFHIY